MEKIEKRKQKLLDYLQKQSSRERQKEERLRIENREDEAIFARIRWNLWHNVFPAFVKMAHKHSDSETDFIENCQKRLEPIQQQWQETLEQAKQFEKYEEVAKEQEKLQTLQEFKQQL